MTLSVTSKTSAVLVAGLLVAGAVAAPAAFAYPPGDKAEVSVEKTKVKPKKPVKAKATNVKPGCVVSFTIRGNGVEKRSEAKANNKNKAETEMKAPSKKGEYEMILRGDGKRDCPEFKVKTKFKVK